MGRLTYAALALLLAGFGAGCSDNAAEEVPADYLSQFYGTWRVTSGGGDIRYIIFSPERNWAILGEDANAYRGTQEGIFSANDFSVSFGGTQFAYLISRPVLSLYNASDTLQLNLETSGPTVRTWVGQLTVLDSLLAPVNQPGDIAAAPFLLWTGSGISAVPTIYRIRWDSGTVTPIPAGTQPVAVEYDGTSLWTTGYFSQQISRLDPATGVVNFTSMNIAPSMTGLAWNGARLWCSSGTTRRTYVYNPATDAIETTFDGVYGDGMAFAGSALYLCKNGGLHRAATATMRALSSAVLPQGYIEGVAWDGASFWVLAATGVSPNVVHKIYRVQLPV